MDAWLILQINFLDSRDVMSDHFGVSKLSFLATALVLTALCLIAVATASSGGKSGNEIAIGPSVTATLPRPAAATATSAPPPFLTPAATPEPGREGPETTLVEVDSKRTLRLWEPGTIVRDTVFSPDGHWLYFTRFDRDKGACAASLYRIDLHSAALLAQRITSGFGLAISSQGYIAFERCESNDSETLHLLLPNGEIRDLLAPGNWFSVRWSPDGRWLTYSSPYLGDGVAMPQTIIDTQSWHERTFATTLPCNCDGGPVAIWAPDSNHFVYTSLLGRPPGETSATSLYDPKTLAHSPAPMALQWIGLNQYLGLELSEQGRQADYFVFDIETGTRSPIPGQATPASNSSLLAVPGSGPSTNRVSLDGVEIVTGLQGFQPQWSPDSAYLATIAQQSDCGTAVLVYGADGRYLSCGSLGNTGARNAPSFSPNSKSLAYLHTSWLENPPRSSATPMTSDLFVIDMASGSETRLASDLRGSSVSCVIWSPDSRYLVAGTCSGF